MRNIGEIKLFILNWYDLIISKLNRSEKRDIEDIKKIIETQKINLKILKKRYYNEASASIEHHDYKFKHLEKELK